MNKQLKLPLQNLKDLFKSVENNWPADSSLLICTKVVFCYQNCSDLLWEKNCSSDREKLLKFEAEGWEFARILRSLEQFVQTVRGPNNFC